MVEPSPRILLVEDERIVALDHARRLGSYGYDVKTVTTGETALETVRTDQGIDLVLMDVDLGPGIDGGEAARRILAERQVPIVFLSSHSERSFVERTEGIASYGYVVKNSEDAVLIASLKMAFRLAQARRVERERRDELEATRMLLEEAERLAGAGSWEWTFDTREIRWSTGMHRLYGRPHASGPFPTSGYLDHIHQDDRPELEAALERARTSGEHLDVTYRTTRFGDREERVFRSVGDVIRDAHGRPVRLVATIQDVTSQTNANERLRKMVAQRDLLLREVNHRVKNNLSLVRALVGLRESAGDADLAVVRNQIGSISLVHELLSRGDDHGTVDLSQYLPAVVRGVLDSDARVDVEADLRVDRLRVPAGDAVSIGLIVTELAMNAQRHAFVPGRPARFSVVLRSAEDERIELLVTNDGRPMPHDAERGKHGSLGLTLVHELVAQLHGTISISRGRTTTFHVGFRLPDLADELTPVVGG